MANFFASSDPTFNFGNLFGHVSPYIETESMKELEELKLKYDNLLKEYTRSKESLIEDFELYKRRVEVQREKDDKRIERSMILEVLDILDLLINILKERKKSGSYSREDELLLDKFGEYLANHDVHIIPDPTGKEFDYSVHEAIFTEDANGEEIPPNTVVKQYWQGYTIGPDNEVLRYAKVSVSKQKDAE